MVQQSVAYKHNPKGKRGLSKAVIVHPSFTHTLPHISKNSFVDLPLACLHRVAGELDNVRDLLRFQVVCQVARRAAGDDALWRNLCKTKFAVPPGANPPSWRELYKFNHEFLHQVILSYATDRLMQTRLVGLSRGMAFNIPVWA